MSEGHRPHPLDDNEDEPQAGWENRTSVAYQPLLKISLITVAASFTVLFTSALATSFAEPSSLFETLSSSLNRLSGLVLLVGFCGILVAYRIPYLKRLAAEHRSRIVAKSGYAQLVGANVVGYFITVFVIYLLLMEPLLRAFAIVVALGALAMFCGLLVTMAMWHTGYVRAYAVGVLTVIVLTLQTGGGLMLFTLPWRGVGSSSVIFPGALLLGIALLTGLICAGYVSVLRKYRQSASRELD